MNWEIWFKYWINNWKWGLKIVLKWDSKDLEFLYAKSVIFVLKITQKRSTLWITLHFTYKIFNKVINTKLNHALDHQHQMHYLRIIKTEHIQNLKTQQIILYVFKMFVFHKIEGSNHTYNIFSIFSKEVLFLPTLYEELIYLPYMNSSSY